MKVLVTGHKGYIGSHLYKRLKDEGYYVKGIDLKEGEDVLYCLPNEDFNVVLHLAAQPSVERSIQQSYYSLRQNVLVTSKVLEWAREHGVKRVVFSSSAAVYGDGDGKQNSPYGLHKLMSEMECEMFSRVYDLDTVSLRYFNIYSEDQPYNGSYSTAISSWMEMIRRGEKLRIDGDGLQTRDFVHVSDIVEANICCMLTDLRLAGKRYDVGSGRSISLNYVKQCIDKYNSIEWNHAPPRFGDIRFSKANISNINEDLGWEPKVSIDEGLERCFNKELK
jgi:UDP-glucose 4-epimerase